MFDAKRGFGFIRPLIGAPDTVESIWFHIHSVQKGFAPPKGARVSFRVVDAPGGRVQAADVRVYERSLKVRDRAEGAAA